MRVRDSLALIALFVVYMVLGSVVFMTLEFHETEEDFTHLPGTWNKLKDSFLNDQTFNGSSSTTQEQIGQLGEHCSNFTDYVPLLKQEGMGPSAKAALVSVIEEECGSNWTVTESRLLRTPWTFDESLYFSMTVLTTIGYGHVSTSTPGGQVFCIFYALFGVPLTGILLAASTNYFSNHLLAIYEKQRHKHNNTTRAVLVAAFICLMPGIFVFILLPAFIFTSTEDWTYLEGVYYAFITLTTIGFGDFVAARNNEDPWVWVYRVAIISWIMFGLGYWFLIAGFITKAFQSKSVKNSWKQAALTLTHHAEEMKKVMAHLKTDKNQEEEVSEQMKFAFQFIAHIADSFYTDDNFKEAKNNYVPAESENKDFHPTGLLALLQMPILHLAQGMTKTTDSDAELSSVSGTPSERKSVYETLGTPVLGLKYKKDVQEDGEQNLPLERQQGPTVGEVLKVLASTVSDNSGKLSRSSSAKVSRNNTPKAQRSKASNATADRTEPKGKEWTPDQTRQEDIPMENIAKVRNGESNKNQEERKDTVLALNENRSQKQRETKPSASKASRKDSKAPLLP